MADVFVSYAREDLPFVRRLTAALQARDRDVWVDLDDIIPSARWREEIRTAITEADAVVFVITPDSVASETVILTVVPPRRGPPPPAGAARACPIAC